MFTVASRVRGRIGPGSWCRLWSHLACLVGRPLDVGVGCGAAFPRSKLGEIAVAVFCGASFLGGVLLSFGFAWWMVGLVLALAVGAGCGVTFPLSKLSCFGFSFVIFLAYFLPVGVEVNFLFSLISFFSSNLLFAWLNFDIKFCFAVNLGKFTSFSLISVCLISSSFNLVLFLKVNLLRKFSIGAFSSFSPQGVVRNS